MPRARRACRRGRHHRRAGARVGGGQRPARGLRGRHAAVHHARLPLPGGGCTADQLPPARVHAAHAGQRVRRPRATCSPRTPTPSRTATGSSATAMRCSSSRIRPRSRRGRPREVRPARHRRPRPPRPAAPAARPGRDPGVHAGRHLRHRQGDDAGGAHRTRRRDRARQHVPPDAAARHPRDPCPRRAARLHALGGTDPDRLGRLPGLQPRGAAQGHGGGRPLPLAGERRPRVPEPRDLDAGPDRARLRHRDGLRRMPAVPGDRSRGAPVDGALDALGAAQPGLIRRPRQPERRCSASSRAARTSGCVSNRSRRSARSASTATPWVDWPWASPPRSATRCSTGSSPGCRGIARAT